MGTKVLQFALHHLEADDSNGNGGGVSHDPKKLGVIYAGVDGSMGTHAAVIWRATCALIFAAVARRLHRAPGGGDAPEISVAAEQAGAHVRDSNSPAHISFVNLWACFVQLGAHGWPQPQGVPDIPPDDTVLLSPKVRLEFDMVSRGGLDVFVCTAGSLAGCWIASCFASTTGWTTASSAS
eukprot:COSAG04_NODE_71_length_29147_cov_8.406018_17_plen_181_part_00